MITPSSDIPRARLLINTAMQTCTMDRSARRYCRLALILMVRAKAVRRAKRKQRIITAAQKAAVRRIERTEPDTHYHEIANRVGLANGGRVSEIVTGRRR